MQLLELTKRELLGGASLEHVTWRYSGREAHVPAPPAIAGLASVYGIVDTLNLRRAPPGDDRDARRQLRPRFVERSFELLAASREQQEPVTEALGVMHDVGREDDRRSRRRHVPDFLLQQALVDRIEPGKGLV